MIVRDINGEKLRLTNVRLTEIVGAAIPEHPWYASLADIVSAADNGSVSIAIRLHEKVVLADATRAWINRMNRSGKRGGFGYAIYKTYCIGCRRFDKKTFDFIVAVAKASAARYQ
jgi:hypothetical protein